MQTIVLATQKGGSGKSTIAIGLALAAQEAGHTVRLIETDQQGTLSNWQRRRGSAKPLVEAVYNAREIESRLQSLALAGVTLAIIDTSGGITAATTEAVRYCDLCMIPARPSIVDIEASAATIELVRAWRKPFAFILNQTPIRSQRNSGAADAIGEQAARDLDDVLARPFIVMRNDHQDALAAGLAVGELSPFGKSADEIRDLWRWVEMRIGGRVAAGEEISEGVSDVEFPIILPPDASLRPSWRSARRGPCVSSAATSSGTRASRRQRPLLQISSRAAGRALAQPAFTRDFQFLRPRLTAMMR